MGITRREFIYSTSLLATALLSSSRRAQALLTNELTDQTLLTGWPIVQGGTDANSASIIILHPTNAAFQPRVTGSTLVSPPSALISDVFHVPHSASSLTQILISGLTPNTDYNLELISADGTSFDQRTFRSLDPHRPTNRFAVVSCMNDKHKEEAVTMWQALAAEQPEFVIFLGDTVYADDMNPKRDEEGYSRRYLETRTHLGWFYQKRLIPSLATWDDHDFGADNANNTFSMAPYTTLLFKKFWGTHFNSVYRQGSGVGSLFTSAGQRFFLMDDRTFRDPSGGARHWGEEQSEWLFQELNASNEPAWIMNGSQYFGGYLKKESYEAHHPEEFKSTMQRLAKCATPVSLVSGDVHFSEVMNIEPEILGYTTREFTSSSIHSMTFPGHDNRQINPRRIVSQWRRNFLMFESSVSGANAWSIDTRCVLNGGAASFNHSVTIDRNA